MIKQCERCGKAFEGYGASKYCCEDCRIKAKREKTRIWKETYPEKVAAQRQREREKEREKRRQARLLQPFKPKAVYRSVRRGKSKTCSCCGKEFEAMCPNAKFCPACQERKRLNFLRQLQAEEAKKRLAQVKFDKATGKPVKTLDDWAREASDCNLDYGTYRALIAAGRTFEQLKAERRSPQFHSHIHAFNRN